MPRGRPKKVEPVHVESTPNILVNPQPEQIARQVHKPVSVEVTDSKPTRLSEPKPTDKSTRGAWLIDKSRGNKRTWMDRSMAKLMALTNPKKYEVD